MLERIPYGIGLEEPGSTVIALGRRCHNICNRPVPGWGSAIMILESVEHGRINRHKITHG
jgi:hypothetical protein